jgi:amino acid adenylation domain-containing protein
MSHPIEDSYALSPVQQGMLFHSLYAGHSGVEIEQMVYTLHEELNVSALMLAWQRVADRHAILRTSFRWEGVDEPIQQVHRSANLGWTRQDWRSLYKEEQQSRLDSYLQEDRRRGFTLREDSLHRFALFQTGATDYEFVWTFHHAIIDGHSFVLVLKEVFAFYESLSRGEELQLPLPRPYRDYIHWLAQLDLSKAERFWRGLLRGFTSPTPLPDSRNPQVNEHQDYTEQETRLSAELTSSLKTLAADFGVTLNTIVQGAWGLLLSRYSGEEDVVYGATRACRGSALDGAEFMVGPFINTLPMRMSVPFDLALIEWLRQIRQQHLTLREYEHTPLMKIQEWSEAPRGRLLFDSILVFQNYELDSYLRSFGESWANREFKLLELTNYKLALSAWAGQELLLKLAYDRRNFTDATIGRMLGHLSTLLKSFAANPLQVLGEVQMLTPGEQHQLLFEWNDTEADYSEHLCIHQLFEAQVERTPESLAVMFEGESLTYRQLNSRANQLAHYLLSFGIRPEQLVGIAMERSPDMIVGLLGILKAGGAYVPLDPAYPAQRLAAMLEDAQPIVLLTQQRLLENFPKSESRAICIDSDWPRIAQESEKNPLTEATSENLAYVIYTSGSTGKPKGVMIEHRSLVNYTESASLEFAIGPADRVLQFASISFDASAEEIYPCLTSGATLVLRNDSMLASISTFLERCQEWGVTIVDLPTAYWHEMAAQSAVRQIALPPCLRLVIVGGERVLPERLAMWQRNVRGGVRLVNTYGPTEATIVATKCDLTSAVEWHASSPDVPIGRAVCNAQTYILDPYLRPVPVGVAGELHIGGAGLARGYLHHPDVTAKSFIANPFSKEPDTRLYKSGDLARFLPDGQIEFCGRVDHQVKIHGFRIELGDIESALLAHPRVQDVIVVAREDTPGDKRLAAYVVPAPESAAHQANLTEELRSFLKNRLPAYMIPAAFVTLEALPVNANGKVDRQQLPAPDQRPTPENHRYVKPNNPLQYQLVQIWEELFDTRPIGVRDNFFELGGHSLLSVRMMDRIEQVLGKKLPLATLFAGATIEHLSEALFKQELATNRSPLVAVQPGGARQPFFYLHGDFQGGGMYCLSLARHLESDQPFYAIQPHGLEGQAIPKTIEEMAEDHIKTLRDFQPTGPYQLGGHCNGGLLAFEMARQLEDAGQEVNPLVLICTTGANARYKMLQNAINHYCSVQSLSLEQRQEFFLKARELAIRMGEIRQYYAGRLKELSALAMPEQIAFVGQKGWKGLKSVAGLISHGKRNGEVQGENANAAFHLIEEGSQDSHAAYARAMMTYVPRKYSGRVTLFWPSEWAAENSNDATTGWRDIAADVDLHIVPGGHLTCLTQHTEELAAHLQRCLHAAQAKK